MLRAETKAKLELEWSREQVAVYLRGLPADAAIPAVIRVPNKLPASQSRSGWYLIWGPCPGMPGVATSGVGGRGGVPARLGVPVSGVKAAAGRSNHCWPSGLLPRARRPLPAAPRPAAPRAFRAGASRGQPQAWRAMWRPARLRAWPAGSRPWVRSHHGRGRSAGSAAAGLGARLYVTGPPRVQVPRLPAPAVVAGIRGSPWAGGVRSLRVPLLAAAPAAAAPPGSQGRGTARTTAGLRVPPGLAEHSVACPLGAGRPSLPAARRSRGPAPGPGRARRPGGRPCRCSRGRDRSRGGRGGVGEDGGLAVLQVVEAVLKPGHQRARFRFPQIAGRHADAHARGAVERDAHRGLAQRRADFSDQREAAQLASPAPALTLARRARSPPPAAPP